MFRLLGVDEAILASLNDELVDWLSTLPASFAFFVVLTTPLLPWILAEASEIE